MHARGWLSVAFALLVSGCVGGGEPQDVEAPTTASFSDGTGAVTGRVIDEEFVAVAQATVGLLETAHQAVTDEQGQFALSEVAPGEYSLAVSRIGFESFVKRVTVVAGEAIDVEVPLVAVQSRAAYERIWTDKGFFECSWHGPIWAGPCFFPGPQTPQPNSKRAWEYKADAGLETLVNELQWASNSLATGSSLRITFSYANRTTSHWYCDAEGNSPLQLRWDREKGCVSGAADPNDNPDEPETVPPEGQVLRSFVNSGAANPPVGTTGMGIAFQQAFDIWTTEFYWAAGPQNYTALP